MISYASISSVAGYFVAPGPEINRKRSHRQYQSSAEFGSDVERPAQGRGHAIENDLDENVVTGMKNGGGP